MKRLQRASALLVTASLSVALISLNLSPPACAQQAATLSRPSPDTVVLTVTVLDRRRSFVEGLGRTHFTVFDNNKPQEITFFKGNEDEPASVGILLDASRSMARVERVEAALARFIRESNRENDYFLIGFNDRPQLLADWTRDGREILSKIPAIKPQHNTALYDACYLGVEKVMRGGRARRVLLLITDGADNASHFRFTELRKLLQESDVTLYAVAVLGGDDPGSTLGMEGQSILEELSVTTGGAVYFPNTSKELDTLFGRIAYELRHQYQLGFKPGGVPDGKWHKIKVKVAVPRGEAPPGLNIDRVRTREGYYATSNPR